MMRLFRLSLLTLTTCCLFPDQGTPFVLLVGASAMSESPNNSFYAPNSLDNIVLTPEQEQQLESGQLLFLEHDDQHKKISVQDFHANKQAVLYQVANLPEYPGKVPKLLECNVYETKRKPDGSFSIKTQMVVNVFMGYKYRYYLDHTFSPQHGSLSWTLDESKTSDFTVSNGIWKVTDHPNKKSSWCRVYYACDIQLKMKAPPMIMNQLTKLNLKQALQWSKRESEAHPELRIPNDDPTMLFSSGELGECKEVEE